MDDTEHQPHSSTTWERVRWPDDEPLPPAGGEITITRLADGKEIAQMYLVVESRPDFEPGWVQVELAPV